MGPSSWALAWCIRTPGRGQEGLCTILGPRTALAGPGGGVLGAGEPRPVKQPSLLGPTDLPDERCCLATTLQALRIARVFPPAARDLASEWAVLLLAGTVLLFGWDRSTFWWDRFIFGWDRSTFGWVRSAFGWDRFYFLGGGTVILFAGTAPLLGGTVLLLGVTLLLVFGWDRSALAILLGGTVLRFYGDADADAAPAGDDDGIDDDDRGGIVRMIVADGGGGGDDDSRS